MKISLLSVCTAAVLLSLTGCGEGELTNVKIPLNIPITKGTTIDLGNAAKCSGDCIKFSGAGTTITQAVPEDGINVDLKQRFLEEKQEYKGYVDSVRAIAIESVTYSVTENTLGTKSPEVSLYIGSSNTSKYTNATKLITLESVPAKTNIPEQTRSVSEDAQKKTGKTLVQDTFKVFPVYKLEAGNDTLTGKAKIAASAKVIVTVNLSALATEGLKKGLQKLGISQGN